MRNSNLAHEFFYAQSNESGAASNFYYQGDTIYSYGSHFPICTKLRGKNGELIAYLFTSEGYSSSTAQHISYTRQAMPNNAPCFNVPKLGSHFSKTTHQENLNHFLAQIKANLKASLGRRKEELKLNDLHQASEMVKRFHEYSKFFKVKIRLTKDKKSLLEWEATEEDVITMLEKAVIAAANVRKRKEAKVRRLRKDDFNRWLKGENVSFPYRLDGFDHLRIKKSIVTKEGELVRPVTIETSQHVTLNCEEAKAMYYGLQQNKVVIGSRISNYTVSAISETELEIGCHLLRISECLEIGKQLTCV